MFVSPGSSCRLKMDFHLACSLYKIGSSCKDTGLVFFPEGNFALGTKEDSTQLWNTSNPVKDSWN